MKDPGSSGCRADVLVAVSCVPSSDPAFVPLASRDRVRVGCRATAGLQRALRLQNLSLALWLGLIFLRFEVRELF